MKKMKMSVLFLLALLSVSCLVACGGNQNDSTTGTSASSSQSSSSAAQESTSGGSGTAGTSSSTGTNASGDAGEESSQGVLDGLMDDVEQGVDDLTRDGDSRASDESK